MKVHYVHYMFENTCRQLAAHTRYWTTWWQQSSEKNMWERASKGDLEGGGESHMDSRATIQSGWALFQCHSTTHIKKTWRYRGNISSVNSKKKTKHLANGPKIRSTRLTGVLALSLLLHKRLQGVATRLPPANWLFKKGMFALITNTLDGARVCASYTKGLSNSERRQKTGQMWTCETT